MAKDLSAIAGLPDSSSMVQSSLEQTAKNLRILLLGAPKGGKTVMLASLSEFFPETVPAATMTHLKDGLIIQFDSGGCDSLAPLNLSVPCIDLSRCTDEASLIQGYNNAALILKKRVESGETTWAAVDGLSTFDKMLKNTLMSRLEKWPLYDAMLGHHMKFFQKLQALAIDLAFACHAKGLGTLDDKLDEGAGRARREASALPGGATIAADITGQALSYYRGQMSLILPVIATKAGKNAKTDYAVYPNGMNGFEAGTRFPLNDKEPPNLNKLLRKIRGLNNKQGE